MGSGSTGGCVQVYWPPGRTLSRRLGGRDGEESQEQGDQLGSGELQVETGVWEGLLGRGLVLGGMVPNRRGGEGR